MSSGLFGRSENVAARWPGGPEISAISGGAKGRVLTSSAHDALAHVVDPLRVRQLVSNLLSNAIKFTEVDGIEVIVRVPHGSTEAQVVEIAVSNNGIETDLRHDDSSPVAATNPF